MSNVNRSKDVTATEAIKKIKSFTKVGDVRSYAKGDTRKTVSDAVDSAAIKIKSNRGQKTTAKKKVETPRR